MICSEPFWLLQEQILLLLQVILVCRQDIPLIPVREASLHSCTIGNTGELVLFFFTETDMCNCLYLTAPLYDEIARTSHCIIATSGMLADQLTLHKTLEARMIFYQHQHRKEMSTPSIAQMLSNTLYYKRFFPYYTFNIIAGLDQEGKGAVYGYDAVGSYQRVPVVCQGTGHELIQPVVDNQVDRKHQAGKKRWDDITEDEAVALVQDSFTSAGERDIYTGDSVDIAIINKDGIRYQTFELKKD